MAQDRIVWQAFGVSKLCKNCHLMACHTPVHHLATDASTVAGSRILLVFLFVFYCDSGIAGGIYLHNMDQVTDMPYMSVNNPHQAVCSVGANNF
jgi:hypothetical protein